MDTKINHSGMGAAGATRRASKRKSLFGFVQELKEELKKVSWTSKEELKLSTKLVVLLTFVFGMGIYLVDLIVKSALDLIALVARLIG